MNKHKKTTGKNFISVSIAIFFSKILGFFRDILIASIFGTTIITDAFQTIFSLPSLLFSSIGTALSSVNIPDLTYYLKHRTKEERTQYIANLLSQITLIGGLISIVGIILAPALTRLIAPGLDEQMTGISILLCKIMMPTLLFVNLTYLSAGILQVHGYFLLSSMISIPFNLLIIITLWINGADIIVLGYVTTIGWLLQFLIQWPALHKCDYHFWKKINFKNPHTRNLYKNIVPILLGNSLLQISLIVDRSFGTHLEEGSTAALAFGSNLFITITSIFIVAMSTVVFPRLSQYCLNKEYAEVRSLLGSVFQVLLFILLPYLLLVTFFNEDIITLVYERGAFNQQSTYITSLSFLLYSYAVIGYACQEIFNRVYYALKKYHIPMWTSIFCIVLNIILNTLFYRKNGIIGLSLSTTFCLLIYAVILFILLRREIGSGILVNICPFLIRLSLPLAGMAAAVLACRQYIIIDSPLGFLLPAFISSAAYLGIAYLLGFKKLLLQGNTLNS